MNNQRIEDQITSRINDLNEKFAQLALLRVLNDDGVIDAETRTEYVLKISLSNKALSESSKETAIQGTEETILNNSITN